ncbi:unnamed protein product [Spodoptera littoralis]|uniref:Uncharacterized protein n=1 Tax=Spodoptera littoralis TaxID=7109 RepID=A0A9P0IJY8_SPOLI|nr:unnamed protein product [Spodoptera littoralis]CAH1647409.1 unnamed protein product [Spodoptera littoralis]
MYSVRTLSQKMMQALNEGSNSSSTPEFESGTDDHLDPPLQEEIQNDLHFHDFDNENDVLNENIEDDGNGEEDEEEEIEADDQEEDHRNDENDENDQEDDNDNEDDEEVIQVERNVNGI